MGEEIMPKVEVQNLFKEYSGRQVLKDITFSVQSGELFVLVGPNRAGKNHASQNPRPA